MSDKKINWENELEKSEEAFLNSESANKSKERIFNALMSSIPSDSGKVPTYDESKEYVNHLSKQGSKSSSTKNRTPASKSPHKRSKKRGQAIAVRFTAVAAVAAVFAVIILNTNKPPQVVPVYESVFTPPLTLDNFPIALSDPTSDFRTIATNNDFYLAYLETDDSYDKINLVVHSRSGDVNWNTLYAFDDNNDLLTPLSIDKSTNIISLPVCESEIFLEVSDSKGNAIECVIPRYL